MRCVKTRKFSAKENVDEKKSVAHCFSLIAFEVFRRRIKKVKKTRKSRIKRTKDRKEKVGKKRLRTKYLRILKK